MNNLTYFDLLSPLPIPVKGLGSIKSPKLIEISRIGKDVYDFYLSLLIADSEKFFLMLGQEDFYSSLSDDEKKSLDIFTLLTSTGETLEMLTAVLSFFIEEKIEYSKEYNSFVTINDKEEIVGLINKDNYSSVRKLICQRNEIALPKNEEENARKISNKAKAILEKIKKGRAELNKKKKVDANMELGNIISSVANKHESLNIITIWDITVFQLWDCFYRLTRNDMYEIEKMSVAAWGDEKKKFQANEWYKKIENGN